MALTLPPSPSSPKKDEAVPSIGRDRNDGPLVSVIVPTLDGDRGGNVARLLADISEQTVKDVEVIVVEGVRPNGRARNVGAARARGRYLVFVDDDVRLGHRGLLANLVGALERNRTFGLVGPSQLVPPDATRFQRAVARQLPRTRFSVVADPVETDMVTHMCLAIPADLWRELGGEHDELVRGTDPDLRNRVRQAGKRVVVVPGTWAYHPPPASLGALLRSAWRGGRGAAWVRRHHPDRAFDVPEGPFAGRVPVRRGFRRIARFAARLAGAALRGRFLLLAADLAYAAGYVSFLLARREPRPEELA